MIIKFFLFQKNEFCYNRICLIFIHIEYLSINKQRKMPAYNKRFGAMAGVTPQKV